MSLIRRCPPLVLSAALFITSVQAATVQTGRTEFSHSIKEVSAAATTAVAAPRVSRIALKDEESSASMNFEVALRMRNFDELQARIARGEQISRAEMASRYFPLAEDQESVVQWLKSQGLEVTRTDDNNLAVFVRGPVNSVAQALQVAFARVTAADGKEFTSAITAPSLPTSVSGAVLGFHGLQPHIRLRPLSIPRTPQPSLQISSGYTPSQVAAAYNAVGLSVNGTGQTIAIYALGLPEFSDLSAFWTSIGVAQTTANVTVITVGEGAASSTDTTTLQEATLDTEWSGALAPGAKIRIYGANENDPGENDEILQQVYADLGSNPSIHQLCICIGADELDVEKDYLIIESQYMASLASAGVSVLSASGDSGAYSDSNEPHSLDLSTPTSDPDVTGVGGTSLVLSGGVVSSENAWSLSGGGVSIVFSRPAWQVGTGVSSGTMRLVPDVAATADPNYGAAYYFQGKTAVVGGTSLATPIWTAFTALLNTNHTVPLGLLNPKLYPLNPASSSSGAFRDITVGSNGYYNAGIGYDECTGLGVPNVTALLAQTFSATTPLAIPSQLGNITTTVGQPATFFVTAVGGVPLSYQWQRMANGSSSWTTLSDNATYVGSATQMLVVNATTQAMTGDTFQCIASDSGGTASSVPETLTVNTLGVTTLAGWPGSAGSANGTGWAARFASPGSVRTDSAGNLYIADSFNNTVRKVTPAGVVTTVAGTAGEKGAVDGPEASALFNGTAGVAPDASGNLYVADDGNATIREISASGTVSTLAGSAGVQGVVDGTGSAARFYDPQNLAYDPTSGNVYVADGQGNVIRKVTPAGVVTTFAGGAIVGGPGTAGSADGTGGAAEFNDPTGIGVDAQGNVYVADTGNDTIRKITPGEVVTTLAGYPQVSGSADGIGNAARFSSPSGIAVDGNGNVFVADNGNSTIRVVSASGQVTTVAGSAGAVEDIDGLNANARFWSPGDVAVDSSGAVYVADSGNQTIRRVVPGSAATLAITAQPLSVSTVTGSSFSLSVGAIGPGELAYQWSLNGTPISGALDATYTVGSASSADAGSYTVTVTGGSTSVSSSAATVTVSTSTGPASRLTNISTRAQVGTGGNIAIAGININASGSETKQVLIRGIGPGLAQPPFNLEGTLSAPTVAVYDTSGNVIVSNTGWANVPVAGNSSVNAAFAQATAVEMSAVGAFKLNSGSGDSALVVSLPAGGYTVELSGVNSTTGVGLVEVYETSTSDPAVMTDISTRAEVSSTSSLLIAGFYISGTSPATVLVRGVGPSLAGVPFNLSGTLAQPVVGVYDQNSVLIASNAGWGNAPVAGTSPVNATYRMATKSDMSAAGAFALTAGSLDSALVLTLPPGAYTAEISGGGSTSGIALAEVYQIVP